MAKIDKVIILVGILALALVYFAGNGFVEVGKGGVEEIEHTVTQALVTRVIDGDTMEVEIGNSTETVRFLGIDTPETDGDHDEGEYEGVTNKSCLIKWAEEAKAHVNGELGGKNVTLVSDSKAGDKGTYGRLLRYVEVDLEGNMTDYTLKLVADGYARAYTESDFEREIYYMEAESKAKEESKRIWSCS